MSAIFDALEAPVRDPIRVPAEAPDRHRIIHDPWQEEPLGEDWCDCGAAPDRDTITEEWAYLGTRDSDRISHRDVIRVTMRLWRYEAVCRFFTLAVEEAAVRVHGSVEEDYEVEVGLAIVKDFSNHWEGCPAQACDADWEEVDISSGRHE